MYNIPDCSDPRVRAQLPEALCNYPPEIIAQICQRQPSLCQPYSGAEQPSIWEPIWGTVEDFGGRIISTGQSVGQGALGTLDLASSLLKIAPYLLIGYGVYILTKR